MTPAKLSTFEPLKTIHLEELIRAVTPCITIYLPPYHPGGTSPRAQRAPFKDAIHTTRERLTELRVADSVAQTLLDPLCSFASTLDADNGTHWTRVIFRAPDFLRTFFLTTNPPGNVTVGDRFEILPLLCELQTPSPFFILKLSQKQASLVRAGLRLEPVALHGPATLDEFLEMDKPDHDLENRGSVGGPSGGRRIRFGSGADRENHLTHVADFFKSIDRAVREIVHDPKTPLVIAGVEEETAMYRTITSHPAILSGSFADQDLLAAATALVREDCMKRDAQTLAEAKEKFAPARYSTDMNAILQAAAEGRVAKLFVAGPGDVNGNQAAVDTLRNSGCATLLPRESMPGHAAIAAVFRY